MGIVVRMRWKEQTEEEKGAQYVGFSAAHGHVGYLREGYHGGPYVTEFLVSEAFSAGKHKAQIAATVLRDRLPEAMRMAIMRIREVYKRDVGEDDPCVKSFVNFVALAERKEKETGEQVIIKVSY